MQAISKYTVLFVVILTLTSIAEEKKSQPPLSTCSFISRELLERFKLKIRSIFRRIPATPPPSTVNPSRPEPELPGRTYPEISALIPERQFDPYDQLTPEERKIAECRRQELLGWLKAIENEQPKQQTREEAIKIFLRRLGGTSPMPPPSSGRLQQPSQGSSSN